MSEELYARQHGTYRTVHESIIVAAKKLIAAQGFRAMNVVDLASEAEVSRATLYNHFRDKEAIGIALAQYEVEGALAFLGTPADFLINFATVISQSEVLKALREHDRDLLPTIFMPNYDEVAGPIWRQVGEVLNHRLGEAAPIAFIWLVGQALAPLSVESIKTQVEAMLPRTLF
jgi:TetR/AcrR family transcriptional regulator, transcriptional repressor of aconitase